MYQVLTMYGDNEPWWFFDDWRADIDSKREFDDFCAALDYYKKLRADLRQTYESFTEKPQFMAAFWNDGEERYCEECDEDLQQYKGLLILKNGQKIRDESAEDCEDQAASEDSCRKPNCCRLRRKE